ncbi:MAG: DoxX family membrane protein [Candidatus Marinimicrobia bacterium]|nr:DoxX family membrane protein [Candidatus Neomarinimicrobiota bacterium]
MKNKIEMGLRILVGMLLAVSGLNKFFEFMPMPEMTESGMAFMMALVQSKYIMPTIAIVEIIGGALLIANMAVPFALVILAPIVFNIFAMHLFLDPAGIGAGVLLMASLGWFAWNRKDSFTILFK